MNTHKIHILVDKVRFIRKYTGWLTISRQKQGFMSTYIILSILVVDRCKPLCQQIQAKTMHLADKMRMLDFWILILIEVWFLMIWRIIWMIILCFSNILKHVLMFSLKEKIGTLNLNMSFFFNWKHFLELWHITNTLRECIPYETIEIDFLRHFEASAYLQIICH